MLAIKYLLNTTGLGMIFAALSILTFDLYRELLHRRAVATSGADPVPHQPLQWQASVALAMLAWGPLLLAFGIVVVPSGMAGVRVSQLSGTVP